MKPVRGVRTRIKICGLRRPEDVEAAVECGADAVGFVFYPPSPRAVSVEQAAQLAQHLPPFVTPVALCVNPTPAFMAEVVQALPTAWLQFQGDESPEQCDALSLQRPYMRAARMRPGFDLLNFARCYPRTKALLMDAHVDGYGGGGKVFDWSLVPPSVPCPVVLSGGLTPANVIDGMVALRPWAVDVSSGVESSRGVKDALLIRRFCDAVRQADARLAQNEV